MGTSLFCDRKQDMFGEHESLWPGRSGADRLRQFFCTEVNSLTRGRKLLEEQAGPYSVAENYLPIATSQFLNHCPNVQFGCDEPVEFLWVFPILGEPIKTHDKHGSEHVSDVYRGRQPCVS